MIAKTAEKYSDESLDLKAEIVRLDENLERKMFGKMEICADLSRVLVSSQGNKSRASYRWFKYKEGFSARLVEYFLDEIELQKGTILDPFAGSGTTLFAAVERGLNADGIEVLPVGRQLITKRETLETKLSDAEISELQKFVAEKNWEKSAHQKSLNELPITRGAYPLETLDEIEKFLAAIEELANKNVCGCLEFALFCVLETVSWTIKDGQYMRWDDRSGRRVSLKKPFSKGEISDFSTAIAVKTKEIIEDLRAENLFKNSDNRGKINLFENSCLEKMPNLLSDSYDAIITSPPYCNRYDYTRIYALELAALGVDETGLLNLRQKLLSCTVENRAKNLLELNSQWQKPIEVADNQKLLQKILEYLENEKREKRLNNNGILRMVRGYFYEMACVIFECARVLKSRATLVMVNDNVRYAGVSISVDLILSDFAEKLGFAIEKILVLPKGKGNSSQQMSEHGRASLRKCVYVWRKI